MNLNNTTTTPVITPFRKLLTSRKFMVSIASLIGVVLTTRIPELAPYISEIVGAILVLSSVLVGTIMGEDIAAKLTENRVTFEEKVTSGFGTVETETKTTVETAVDILFEEGDTPEPPTA